MPIVTSLQGFAYTEAEIQAIRVVAKRAQESGVRYTFPELAEQIKIEANSPKSIALLEMNLHFTLMPLCSEDDDEELIRETEDE